jgi:hypothetical protein
MCWNLLTRLLYSYITSMALLNGVSILHRRIDIPKHIQVLHCVSSCALPELSIMGFLPIPKRLSGNVNTSLSVVVTFRDGRH